MLTQTEERADDQLVRAIGIPALTANIINSTIGAGIFVLPALVAKGLGGAAPVAFVACAIAMVLFVTCFAVAGSRVSLTGGLYAYVEVAFGRYIGFLAGVLYGITAITAVAGVVNVLVNSIGGVVPFFGNPIIRVVVMFLVYGLLVVINVRGVRAGAGAVTAVTLAKLLPLLLFVGAGIFFIHPANIAWSGFYTTTDGVEHFVRAMVDVTGAVAYEYGGPDYTLPVTRLVVQGTTTLNATAVTPRGRRGDRPHRGRRRSRLPRAARNGFVADGRAERPSPRDSRG